MASANPYSYAAMSGGSSTPSSSTPSSTNPFSLLSLTSGASKPKKKSGIFGVPGIGTLTQLGLHALGTAATALNQPQQIITHLVAGDVAGAGRAAGRTAANAINPLSVVGVKLPGQKALGDPEKDRLTLTEALAKDGFTGLKTLKAGPVGPLARFAAETASDPLSYVTFGAAGPAKAALKEVGQVAGEDIAKAVAEKGVRGLTKEEAAHFTETLGERAPALAKTLDKAPGGMKIGVPFGPKATLPGTPGASTALREAAGRGIQRLATGTADLAGGTLGEKAPRLASALDQAAMGAQEHVVNPVLNTADRAGRLFSNVKRIEGALKDAGVADEVATKAASLVRRAEQEAVAEVGSTVSKNGSELRAALQMAKPPEDAIAKFLVTGGKDGLEKFPEMAQAIRPILERTGAFQTALTGVSSRLAKAGTREAAAEAVLKPALVEKLQREVVPMLREHGLPEDVLQQVIERGPTKAIPSAPELKTALARGVKPDGSSLGFSALKTAAAEKEVAPASAELAAALRNPEIATAMRQTTGRGSSLAKELVSAFTKDGITRPKQFSEVAGYLVGKGGLENAPAVRAVLDKLPSAVGAARVGQDALGPVPDAVVKALAESKTPIDAVMNLAVRGAQKDAERALEHSILNSGLDEKVVSAMKEEIRKAVRVISDEDMSKFLRGWEKAVGLWRRGAVQSPGFHIRNIVGNTWVNFLRGVRIPQYLAAAKDQLAIREVAGNSAFREDIAKLGMDGALEKHIAPESLTNLRNAQRTGIFSSNFFQTDVAHSGLRQGLEHAKHPLDTLLRPLQVFGSSAEDWARYANYLQGIEEGLSPEGAASLVRRYLFDYQDLTPFERHGLKNVIPFYTFMRKNVPLQLSELVQQPGKFEALFHARQELDKGNRIPETSGEAAFKSLQPITSAVRGDYSGAARGLVGMPGGPAGLPRVALENSLGVSNYTGRTMAPQGKGSNLLSGISPGAAQVKKLLDGTTAQRTSILTGVQQPTSANTAGAQAKPKAKKPTTTIKKVPKPKKVKIGRTAHKSKVRFGRRAPTRSRVRITRSRPRIRR